MKESKGEAGSDLHDAHIHSNDGGFIMKGRWVGVGLATGLLSLVAMNYMFMGGSVTESPMATGIGNVDTVMVAYERWKEGYQKNIGEEKFVMGLGFNKGLSSEFTKAYGEISVDLTNGEVSIYAHGLPENGEYEVWLIDNQDGSKMGVAPDQGDHMIRLGRLAHENNSLALKTVLDRYELRGFELDLVAVTKAGNKPEDGSLLLGMPSLFQKLYYNELRQPKFLMASIETSADETEEQASSWTAPFQALVPTPAYAANGNSGGQGNKNGLKSLVSKGEDLFFNETFDGNGRTCGTCHSALNNFTIDEKFIASLPPTDKLFVAEHGVGLDDLEKPDLMRKFALILENLDGFEKPGLMRATPHTFALNTSLTPGPDVEDAGRTDAIGWSGDGAPLPGGLRNFATGAVVQHFTRCLPRPDPLDPGDCFRLPTDEELDALEAFQRSLGRQADPNLETLTLKGFAPALGQQIFLCDGEVIGGTSCSDVDVLADESLEVAAGKCLLCHANAGATMAVHLFVPADLKGKNANLDTGVAREITIAKLYDPAIPCDGGFGIEGVGNCEGGELGEGSGAFNVPPLVEAADTLGLFHNNLAQTLRNGMAFYNGGAFNNSSGASVVGINGFGPGGGAIGLSSPDIDAVSQFLEVLNSLENIRNALGIEKRALDAAKEYQEKSLKTLIEVAHADTEDAYQVLDFVPEHISAKEALKEAASYLEMAAGIDEKDLQKELIAKAMEKQRFARDSMCVYGSDKVLCKEQGKV